jgi:hypothetical protein
MNGLVMLGSTSPVYAPALALRTPTDPAQGRLASFLLGGTTSPLKEESRT